MTRDERQTKTSAAWRRRNEELQCPACKRKAALKRVRDVEGALVAVVCRWCKHEEARPGI